MRCSEQGERLGGEAGAGLLDGAAAAHRAALRVYAEAEYPDHWARTQNYLGSALAQRGLRLGGKAGAVLLGEAVAIYRDALSVWTEAADPDGLGDDAK